MRNMLLKGLLGGFILVGIMFSGCSTINPEAALPAHSINFSPDTNQVPRPTLYIPNQVPFSTIPDVSIEPIPGMMVNISGSNKSFQIGPRENIPATSPPVSEKPLFTTFHAGESANDGNTRVTLNSVTYNKSFSLEPYNQHGEFESYRPGYELMLLEVSIRDIGEGKSGNEDLFNGIIIKDSKGQRYTPGLSIISDLNELERDRTGYLFYEVPINHENITLNYHFPGSIGVVAKFDLNM